MNKNNIIEGQKSKKKSQEFLREPENFKKELNEFIKSNGGKFPLREVLREFETIIRNKTLTNFLKKKNKLKAKNKNH